MYSHRLPPAAISKNGDDAKIYIEIWSLEVFELAEDVPPSPTDSEITISSTGSDELTFSMADVPLFAPRARRAQIPPILLSQEEEESSAQREQTRAARSEKRLARPTRRPAGPRAMRI
ncbi:hypothetical protein NM688_g5463 [Phlebia brevispora]|uniref:Uncharacterized protein n=1 Tax=Phlebia brevispora TaxID=194682 RepID=A0ACC1SVG6_9APHY|nr:hypothetical protein NM688_g5463 [Phlebia brevispora]